VQGDAMERLEKLKGAERRFGLVMAVMPKKSAGSRLNFMASKHTAGLAARAIQLLAPGGVAAFSLAASELSARAFRTPSCAGPRRRGLRLRSSRGPIRPDFPEITGFEHGGSRRFLAMKAKALA